MVYHWWTARDFVRVDFFPSFALLFLRGQTTPSGVKFGNFFLITPLDYRNNVLSFQISETGYLCVNFLPPKWSTHDSWPSWTIFLIFLVFLFVLFFYLSINLVKNSNLKGIFEKKNFFLLSVCPFCFSVCSSPNFRLLEFYSLLVP